MALIDEYEEIRAALDKLKAESSSHEGYHRIDTEPSDPQLPVTATSSNGTTLWRWGYQIAKDTDETPPTSDGAAWAIYIANAYMRQTNPMYTRIFERKKGAAE